jgi:hypothetical protein
MKFLLDELEAQQRSVCVAACSSYEAPLRAFGRLRSGERSAVSFDDSSVIVNVLDFPSVEGNVVEYGIE